MARKASGNVDKGKLGDSMQDNHNFYMEHGEDQDFDPMEFVSASDVLSKVLNELDYKGYTLVPSYNGDWSGHEVYKRSPFEMTGVTSPEGFEYLKRVHGRDETLGTQFKTVVKNIINALLPNAGKVEQKYLNSIGKAFCDSPQDIKQIPYASTRNLAANAQIVKKPSLLGTFGAFKLVPPLSWFKPEIQALDPKDLLTLLPDAEADQMMLLLGRTVAGSKSSEAMEGLIEHTFRSYCIMVGDKPGLGKSTFLTWLTETLKLLGYTVVSINTNDSKFGWGKVATADLAVVDDLTDKTQKRLFADVKLKSIVSNGALEVEDKGEKSVEVTATTTILGCSNKTDYTTYIDMDSGSISRLNQLYTYTEDELKQRYPDREDPKLMQYWLSLAEKLGVPVHTIMAYLLRKSLDRFLEVTGYNTTGKVLKRDRRNDHLEQVVKVNRKRFLIDCDLRHSQELINVTLHLMAMAVAKDTSLLPKVEASDFSPDLLLELLKYNVESEVPDDTTDMVWLRELAPDAKASIKAKLTDLGNLKQNRSVLEAFTLIVKELKSTKGFGYPSSTSYYQTQWMSERRGIQFLYQQYQGVSQRKPLERAISKVASWLNEVY